jgi:ketosteroid isomerase-like protein
MTSIPVQSSQDAAVNEALDPLVLELRERATQAHIALMQGDVARYRSFMMLDDSFMLMSPMGSLSRRGYQYSENEWAEIGRFFRDGRESTFDLIRAYRGTDVVVLVALEHTHVRVGSVPAQPWALRVTLVFRKSGDRWLLAHRHADPLVWPIDVAQSAALARAR